MCVDRGIPLQILRLASLAQNDTRGGGGARDDTGGDTQNDTGGWREDQLEENRVSLSATSATPVTSNLLSIRRFQ